MIHLPAAPLLSFRSCFLEFVMCQHGIAAEVARRQLGKTDLAAKLAVAIMIAFPGVDVVFMSLTLTLAKDTLRRQRGILGSVTDALPSDYDDDDPELEAQLWATLAAAQNSADRPMSLHAASPREGGRILLPEKEWTRERLADVFQYGKLEMQMHHTNSITSRSILVAASPDAVGRTGWVVGDEVSRWRDFQGVHEAAKPIMASSGNLKMRYLTTPPYDDTHYSHVLLAPGDQEFEANPTGNWYESKVGKIPCHRVSAYDADLAGFHLYDDKTRQPLTAAEHRAKEIDFDAWERNFNCAFGRGGSGAISLRSLLAARTGGASECTGVNWTETLERGGWRK